MGNAPMRLEFPLNLDVTQSKNGNRDDDKSKLQQSMHQQLLSTSSLMGSKPPPLYEAALIGNWKGLLDRLASHPSEASYSDRCKNTPLHLACRRQPPPEVVNALINADFDSSKSILHKTTVDGLSALHFACYCGADINVVELLLGMKYDGSGSMSHSASVRRNLKMNIYSRRSIHLVDRRGRTPLHCACAGFRTPNRPEVIHAYLKYDPSSSTVSDEKGRTPFSLMYDDYAEEIDEVLHPSFDAEKARACCLNDEGSLQECWKILVLLLRAAYLGNVEDALEASLALFEFDHVSRIKLDGEEKKHHSLSPARQRSDNASISSHHSKSSKASCSSTVTSNQIDLTHPDFRLLHAASACVYQCPHGFFQLLLKVCGKDRIKEHDSDFHLPLHLAARASPPPSISNRSANPNRYSISSSFHGQSSTIYEEKSGVTLHYYPNAVNGPGSRNHKFKQYSTTSFQPSAAFTTHQTPIISHLLDIYSDAASIPDDYGKFPLSLAIESGKSYEFVIAPLLDAFPQLLLDRSCSVTKIVGDGNGGNDIIGIEESKTVVHIEEDHAIDDGGDTTAANVAGIDAIHSSLINGLTNPSVGIRNETASTVGFLMRRIRKLVSEPQKENNLASAHLNNDLNSVLKVDEFLRSIIRTSGRYGSFNSRRNQDRSTTKSCNNEWTGIQATMLQALSAAMSNIRPSMIQIPATPQLALDVASNMLKHEDVAIRECAACCIGAALDLLPDELLAQSVDRIVLLQRQRSSVIGMELSMHSLQSSQSTESFQTLLSEDRSTTSAIGSTARLIRSSEVTSKSKISSKIHNENLKLLKIEAPHVRHGRALAYFRILTSAKGDIMTLHCELFNEALLLMQELMLNDEAMIREAACLAMGAVLGVSFDTDSILKEVRHTILKCMRTTEESEVHIALARGLMVATQMKPHIFICKAGTPILEGALILCHQSAQNVQKMFHAFLWLALGIGDKDSAHYGLSEYMALAEGENGKIMMSLVTKTLAKIESVHDILWSSTVDRSEHHLSAYI